ncbi:MAG: nucleotide disphospho-sugar-binding domain-containing protein, partial [Candidatus Paceibacterota bacterium]
LVSVSTEMQDDGAIIETALSALSDQQESVIVTTSVYDPDRFKTSQENVYIKKFLPHARVIPQMDVVVTHGGMGTIQRALAAGVPVCVVPWGGIRVKLPAGWKSAGQAPCFQEIN